MMQNLIDRPVTITFSLVVVTIIAVGLIVASAAQYDTLNFAPVTYDAVVDVLMPVLFVALLVERLLEVFVSGARKMARVPLERAVEKAKRRQVQLEQRLKRIQEQLDAPNANTMPPDEKQSLFNRQSDVHGLLATAERNIRRSSSDMDKFKSETRRASYVVGTALGLAIALAGIRVLAPLVDFELADWGGFQEFVFHSADVVLTAALLAGGAAGIHQVISVFGDYTKKVRANVQQS